MVADTLSRGREGEELASSYLKSLGYKILERNFKRGHGEIDIIARDEDTLVFVEVKTRWSKRFGLPEEAVTPRKLRYLVRTAKYYKMLHPELPESMRIDVVAVDLSPSRGEERIRLIKNVTG